MQSTPQFESFFLSPLDQSGGLLFCFVHLSFETPDQENALKTINDGVNNLLIQIPFLGGEVALDGENRAIEVRPATLASEAQVPMVQIKHHANRSLPVKKLEQTGFSVPQDLPMDELFNPLAAFPTPDIPIPVVRFQANLVSNGIILAMGFNHAVFDAIGAFELVKLLGDACRSPRKAEDSGSTIACSQLLRRSQLLALTTHLKQKNQNFNASGAAEEIPDPSQQLPVPQDQILANESVVLCTKRVKKLWSACNAILDDLKAGVEDENGVLFLSVNDVVTALLSEAIAHARHTKDHMCKDEQSDLQKTSSSCFMVVSLRDFLGPPLLEAYLGNAVMPLGFQVEPRIIPQQHIAPNLPERIQETLSSLKMPVSSFLRIAKTACTIRRELASFSNSYVGSLASFLNTDERQTTERTLQACAVASSLRHIKSYELPFGANLGDLRTLDSAVPWWDGSCVILPLCATGPKVADSAPWVVRITLEKHTMGRFKDVQALSCMLLKHEGNNASDLC